MIVAMEVIAFGLHKDDLSDNFATAAWDSDSKNSANSLLHAVTGFQFLVLFSYCVSNSITFISYHY